MSINYDKLAERAERGDLKVQPGTVRRGAAAAADAQWLLLEATGAERGVELLAETIDAKAQVVSENGGWSVMLPGLPIAADGATIDEALDEAVHALRAYATAWNERLRLAPNHAGNGGLVQLVDLASNERLKAWLTSA